MLHAVLRAQPPRSVRGQGSTLRDSTSTPRAHTPGPNQSTGARTRQMLLEGGGEPQCVLDHGRTGVQAGPSQTSACSGRGLHTGPPTPVTSDTHQPRNAVGTAPRGSSTAPMLLHVLTGSTDKGCRLTVTLRLTCLDKFKHQFLNVRPHPEFKTCSFKSKDDPEVFYSSK